MDKFCDIGWYKVMMIIRLAPSLSPFGWIDAPASNQRPVTSLCFSSWSVITKMAAQPFDLLSHSWILLCSRWMCIVFNLTGSKYSRILCRLRNSLCRGAVVCWSRHCVYILATVKLRSVSCDLRRLPFHLYKSQPCYLEADDLSLKP